MFTKQFTIPITSLNVEQTKTYCEMILPLDVQLLKIGLQFVAARAKGDWDSASKLIKPGSFDTKSKLDMIS